MNNEKQVVFRRIRGRIVPIRRQTEQVKSGATGAALIAAGVAASAGAGKAYRFVNRAATRTSVKAFGSLERIQKMKFTGKGPNMAQMSFVRYAREQKAQNLAMKALKKARFVGSFSAPLRLGGRAFGASLIGVGAVKLTESFKNRSISNEQAAGIGAGASLGAFLTGSHGGAGYRQATKGIHKAATPHLRHLKTLLRL